MKLMSFFFCIFLLVSCGQSKKENTPNENKTNGEIAKSEPEQIELSSDEESVLRFLKENIQEDLVAVGYGVGKRLNRDVKNINALIRAIELLKNEQNEKVNELEIKSEIKKI